MAHIIKEERAEPMCDYAVYIIISPFDDKTFFISKTKQDRLRKTYAEHYGLRVSKTKALFERAKEENLLPALYILEAQKMSGEEAFGRCVAWTKYFLEHGFTQTKTDILTVYAKSLSDSTAEFYAKIRDEKLEDVLQPKDGIFPEYGKRNRVENKLRNINRAVPVHFDNEEYTLLKNKAEELGLSLNSYCRRMILNGRIVQTDFGVIGKYLEEFTSSKTLIKQIGYSIFSTGNYFPADLENIQNFIDQLTELEKKVNEEMSKTIHTLRE